MSGCSRAWLGLQHSELPLAPCLSALSSRLDPLILTQRHCLSHWSARIVPVTNCPRKGKSCEEPRVQMREGRPVARGLSRPCWGARCREAGSLGSQKVDFPALQGSDPGPPTGSASAAPASYTPACPKALTVLSSHPHGASVLAG